ncbi:TetR family transcriptional regulator [Nonomuraea sp. NPDC046802]|uniref:TetR family transcriptional regulator n=1 Tax=Nonomuraea sp. NPDC046802 TaxID=3154919 RepID=UPI0033DF5AC2
MEETRRERKKRQTKELLVATALRLFAEQGYEETTVAQIASVADVATKTFFNYFPSKEDVLFAEIDGYMDVVADVVAARQPSDTVADVLLRTCEQVIVHYLTASPTADDDELAEVYERLVVTVPAVRAKALHRMFDMQRTIAHTLLEAFPGRLDPVSAAAATGALVGAVQGAGMAVREQGLSKEGATEAVARSAEIVMRGLRAL